MIYLSRMLGKPVLDASGVEIGHISDIAIATGEVFPRVTSLAFKGADLTSTIATFVKEYGITHVVLGRTRQPWHRRWFSRSVLDRLLQAVPGVDVTVVDNSPPS